MIDLFFMNGYTVAVMGLGRSGLATARALLNSGAELWAWDDSEDRRAEAKAADIPLVDLYHCNWGEPVSLILSPGIPLHQPEPHPVVKLAEAADVEVIGDIELLGRAQRNASYVGVTGTNGKSTTTTLIGHVMEMAGREVQVGGNLGAPALSLDPLDSEGTYVLEMSSYQLDLTRCITFDVAILLNLSPDHLERHGGMRGYVDAKRQIFRRQTKPRSAVVGVDDDDSRAVYRALAKADEQIVVPVSGREPVPGGIFVRDGWLYDDTSGQETQAVDVGRVVTLPGEHNWQNAAAAYATCKAIGLAPPMIAAAINSYPGLAHRQEPVLVVDGVLFVNDSKATNCAAAAKALACYRNIYWIAGGRPKEKSLAGLEPYFKRIAHAFVIGEAAEMFAEALAGQVETARCGDLRAAVDRAFRLARSEKRSRPVVLLSPACASFDQFGDFEARGESFRGLVEALPGERLEPFEHQEMVH